VISVDQPVRRPSRHGPGCRRGAVSARSSRQTGKTPRKKMADIVGGSRNRCPICRRRQCYCEARDSESGSCGRRESLPQVDM